MNQPPTVHPRLLKGFRDFHPSQQSLRNYYITQLQEVFSQFGFQPLDSPVLEYEEVLLGKGGGETEKQVYRFTDNGARKVAMRFDLTVPFARYVAMHYQTLNFPFFRYQIGKVFRGENAQKGRYREFMQCDFDIIGVDSVSADLTILQCLIAALQTLKIDDFTLHVSHRGIFSQILTSLPAQQQLAVMRLLDKLHKIGEQELKKQLESLIPHELSRKILDCIEPTTPQDTLKKVRQYIGDNHSAYMRIAFLLDSLKELSLDHHVMLDLSITRGLDYYTGLVYETFLTKHPEIGSICSGGRYNNLCSLYSQHAAPGVGASFGLDRLLSVISPAGYFSSPTSIVVFPMDTVAIPYCHSLLPQLHKEGWQAKIFSSPKGDRSSLKDLFKYTDKDCPDFTIVIGTEELAQKNITIKHLHTKEQASKVSLHAGIQFIHEHSSSTR